MSQVCSGRLPHRRRDPIRVHRRQRGMAPPELISLIVAVIAWIVLLGSFTVEG
jgi:hypothetical protein